MKTLLHIALCFPVLLGLATLGIAQEKLAETPITILVPEKGHAETVIKVRSVEAFDGGTKSTTKTKDKTVEKFVKVIKGKGETRIFKPALPQGKEYRFEIEAEIQPNNYTRIFRAKEITLKGGDSAKVDLTVKDSKTDRIVVRWVPTPDDIVDEMCKLAKVVKDDVVYDLGCGDAVMLIRPIQKFGVKKGVGIDIDPKMITKAKEKAKEAKVDDRVELRVGDILNVKDMSDATVVLLYIGDDLGERLSPVLQRTLKPGARIVSHRFGLGDWKPTTTTKVKGIDGDEYELHLWVVGEKKETKIDKESK
jgi:uncharacterized protein (TIGR03000 family)